jgi:hypothetical protein
MAEKRGVFAAGEVVQDHKADGEEANPVKCREVVRSYVA